MWGTIVSGTFHDFLIVENDPARMRMRCGGKHNIWLKDHILLKTPTSTDMVCENTGKMDPYE
jgi:hypothetical protein